MASNNHNQKIYCLFRCCLTSEPQNFSTTSWNLCNFMILLKILLTHTTELSPRGHPATTPLCANCGWSSAKYSSTNTECSRCVARVQRASISQLGIILFVTIERNERDISSDKIYIICLTPNQRTNIFAMRLSGLSSQKNEANSSSRNSSSKRKTKNHW